MKSKVFSGAGIGAGYFSAYQYEAWQRLPDVEMVALADLDEAKARAMAARYGIPRVYTDYRNMLAVEQPDFVDVVTPPPMHFEICTYAAGQGCDVICQKPLAPTYQNAVKLVDAVEAHGVRLAVHENWRWQPWYREIKSMLEAGTLGEPRTLYFRVRTGDGWGEDAYLDRQPYFREYPRLFIYETGVHFIDTFRYLFGEVSHVYTQTRRLNPIIQGEDAALIVLTFTSGATAMLDANRYNEPETDEDVDPRYTFGTLRLDASKGHLRLHPDGRLTIKPLGATSYTHPYTPSHEGFAGDSVYRLQSHIIEAFRSGAPFESTTQDYLRTLEVVEACYTSAAEGQVVVLT